jgi:hypothetical protein
MGIYVFSFVFSLDALCHMDAERVAQRLRETRDAQLLTSTAREGLALLKGGAMALKHGRAGKPKKTLFTLSEDESKLTWRPAAGEGLGKLAVRRLSSSGAPQRELAIADAVEIVVGRESAAFQRRANDTGLEHLSLTLKLMAALPAPPSADGDDKEDDPSSSRETLDVSFGSEEQFGLWVAALRYLIKHRQACAVQQKRQTELVGDLFRSAPARSTAPPPATSPAGPLASSAVSAAVAKASSCTAAVPPSTLESGGSFPGDSPSQIPHGLLKGTTLEVAMPYQTGDGLNAPECWKS